MVYIISYDLNKSGQDYQKLYKAIKECSTGIWIHCLDSTWLIKSYKSTSEIQRILKNAIDDNDSLLVMEVKNNYSGWLPKDVWDYLSDMFKYSL